MIPILFDATTTNWLCNYDKICAKDYMKFINQRCMIIYYCAVKSGLFALFNSCNFKYYRGLSYLFFLLVFDLWMPDCGWDCING